MQIKKVGSQPTERYSIIPNDMIRDIRLSRRARGVMAEVCSNVDGYHVNAESLAATGPEGRDAMRAAINELIATGYMRRVRYQDEQGRWVTRLNVYIYGDAPEFVGVKTEVEVTDADLEEPTPENHPSVDQPLETQPSTTTSRLDSQQLAHGSVLEDQEEDSPTSLNTPAAALDHPTDLPTDGPAIPNFQSLEHAAPAAADRTRIPTVLQWALRDAGAPVTDIDEWTRAWATALSTQWPEWAQMEAVNFPNEHLMAHLIDRKRSGREPKPELWMRFFLEDRVKQLAIIAAARESAEREFEDPNEREDRQNRHLPPDRSGDEAFFNTPEGQAMIAEAQRKREARQAGVQQ